MSDAQFRILLRLWRVSNHRLYLGEYSHVEARTLRSLRKREMVDFEIRLRTWYLTSPGRLELLAEAKKRGVVL